MRAMVQVVAVLLALAAPAPAQHHIEHAASKASDVDVVAAAGTNISNTPVDSLNPVIAVQSGRIDVAWIESEPTTDGLRATIMATTSTNGGGTFAPPQVVAALFGYATGLRMVSDGATIHLAWLATAYTIGTPTAVDYCRSVDGGVTFGEVLAVNGAAPPGIPDLQVVGEQVAVAWTGGGTLWLATSGDAGGAFGKPEALSASGVAAPGSGRIALGAGGVAAVWIGAVDGRVYCLPSLGGVALALSTEGVAATEAGLCVAPWGFLTAWNEAGAVRSQNFTGDLFHAPLSLGACGTPAYLRLDSSAESVHLAWLTRESYAFAHVGADDAYSAGIVLRPKVIAHDLASTDYVVATSWLTGKARKAGVRVAIRPDGSHAWTVYRLARKGGNAAPAVAADGGRAWAVWQGSVNGAYDVFVGATP